MECLTDNKNRTVAEVRHVFSKYNGSLGEKGCVGWMFKRRGMIYIPTTAIGEDELMEIVLENGAEDLKTEEENYEVRTSVEDYTKVLDAIKAKNIEIESSEIEMIPTTFVKLEGKPAEQMLKLAEKLEELEDAQNVWYNFDISPEEI